MVNSLLLPLIIKKLQILSQIALHLEVAFPELAVAAAQEAVSLRIVQQTVGCPGLKTDEDGLLGPLVELAVVAMGRGQPSEGRAAERSRVLEARLSSQNKLIGRLTVLGRKSVPQVHTVSSSVSPERRIKARINQQSASIGQDNADATLCETVLGGSVRKSGGEFNTVVLAMKQSVALAFDVRR